MKITELGLLEYYADMDGVTPARYIEVWCTAYTPTLFPVDLERHMNQRFPRSWLSSRLYEWRARRDDRRLARSGVVQ